MAIDLLTLLSPKNLLIFVIILTRLSGMMTTMPLISKYSIPVQVKTWFMALIAFILFPLVAAKINFAMPTSVPEITIILLKEFMIGYIVGFVADIIFIAVEISAELLSMQMGLTAAQALNPLTGDTSPILSQAYTLMAAMIFLGINGFQWVFSAIYKTFMIMTPGYSIIVTGNIANNIVLLTGQIFTVGLSLVLPIFSVLVITDVLLGFTAKMMPKMNIFMVALPAKIYVGLVLFIMLMPHFCSHLQTLFGKYLSSIIPVLGG